MHRWLVVAVLVIAIVLSVVVGAPEASTDAYVLTIASVSAVASVLTLFYVVPKRAKVEVMRQDELGLTDLIFYLYDEAGTRVPRDYLLQLHVAVANTGGRKAVVSGLEMRLRDSNGIDLRLPGATEHFNAHEYQQTSGYRNHTYYFENASRAGPWLLEPGDVITLRFRSRRGIDWSSRWDLPKIREYHDALKREVFSAVGTVTYREERRVRRDLFDIRVHTKQQSEFTGALRTLTDNFTQMPEVQHRQIDLE